MKKIYLPFFKAFVGGVLAGISLGEGHGILMPFAIALLWSASRNPWAGFCWGSIAILFSHKWLLALHPISWIGINPNLSLPITIFIWLFCGGVSGALIGIWSCLRNFFGSDRLQIHRVENTLVYAVCLAILWGLSEEILSRGPLFWVGIGSSLLPQDRILAGLARWVGSGGLASIQILIGWWIWQVSIAFEAKKKLKQLLVLGFTSISIAHLIGFLILLNSPAFGEEKVAVWQTNIPIREKFSTESIKSFPLKLNSVLTRASDMKASFLIAPEGTLPLNQIKNRIFPIKFLSGGFRKVRGSTRSSLLAFNPGEETFSAALDKSRLVPLGEWIPAFPRFFKSGLSAVGGLESGDSSRLLNWEGPTAAGVICYELSNGTAIAKAVKQGGQWILVIANLDPYPISLQRQFLSIAQLRSIETSRNVISVSNTGPTSLIKSNGEIDSILPSNQELLELIDLNLASKKTAYVLMGNIPIIIIFIWSLFTLFRLRRYQLDDFNLR